MRASNGLVVGLPKVVGFPVCSHVYFCTIFISLFHMENWVTRGARVALP